MGLPYTVRMVLLALDTSTESMALALWVGEQLHTHEALGGAQASQRLLPDAAQLLERAGLVWRDVQALAFGQGPGAFTGLRTACSAVQGLALGLGVRVVALDSLMIVAEDALAASQGRVTSESDKGSGMVVRVAMDARMGQLYAAQYEWTAGAWRTQQPPGLWEAQDLANCWAATPPDRSVILAGSGLMMLQAAGMNLQSHACMPVETSRASALGRLARSQWTHGPHLDAAQAMPVYVRDKVALTTEERQRATP